MRNTATILEAGQGTLLSARGSAMFFKATRASTDGAFSLMERTLPPGGRNRRLTFTQTARKLSTFSTAK